MSSDKKRQAFDLTDAAVVALVAVQAAVALYIHRFGSIGPIASPGLVRILDRLEVAPQPDAAPRTVFANIPASG